MDDAFIIRKKNGTVRFISDFRDFFQFIFKTRGVTIILNYTLSQEYYVQKCFFGEYMNIKNS